MYPHSNLGADSYGPPRPGQTDKEFQTQMSAPVALAAGAALALFNPFVGLAVGVGLLVSASRPRKTEKQGGH